MNHNPMKKKGIKIGLGIVFTILFVLLDQVTKQLAVTHLKHAPSFPIISGVFELSYLENHGAAFGILQGQKVFLILVTLIAFLILTYLYIRVPEKKYFLPIHLILVLLISGAIGNFIDRCVHNYVIDFFYFKLINFPVFNVADIYVTVSACLIAILFLFYYKEEDIDLLLGLLIFWKKKEKQ